jgi:toxin ParE1/3/4
VARKKLTVAPAAEADLLAIHDYVWAESGEKAAADRMIRFLDAEFGRLAKSPGIGHVREDLTDKPLRFWTKFSYLIVYQEREDGVTIFRVLHGARDVRELLEG